MCFVFILTVGWEINKIFKLLFQQMNPKFFNSLLTKNSVQFVFILEKQNIKTFSRH